MDAAVLDPAGARSQRRSWRWIAAAVLAVAIAVVVLLWGITDNAVYFKTADEAVAERDELGSRRFRVEGVVVRGTVREGAGEVRFDIEENGATVPVTYTSPDPPELFQPDIPVVLEGRWAGERFESDRIMVKHTEEYQEENPDRVDDYVGDGDVGDGSGGADDDGGSRPRRKTSR